MTSQEFLAKTGISLHEGRELKIERGYEDESEIMTYRVSFVNDNSDFVGLIDDKGKKENVSIRYLYGLFARDRVLY